jgi:AhpD family alkylhydroperoxidase
MCPTSKPGPSGPGQVDNIFKAATTLELVHLRASRINGCSACVDSGVKSARKTGETDERLLQVVAWRESDLFTDAERAALAMTEAATRLADRPDTVTDEIWDAAGPLRRAAVGRDRPDDQPHQSVQPDQHHDPRTFWCYLGLSSS